MNADFISAIQELGKEKGIDPELLFQAVDDALVAAYKKNTGTNQNVRVEMNKETGEIHVYAQRTVVEGEADGINEMTLEDAQAINPQYLAGDIVEVEVTPKNFGRIAAQNAKQFVVQRIREAERGQVYERFQSRANDIVTGIIERMENQNVYIDLGKVEAVLTPNEQIPGEIYQYHERMKTYIVEVKRTNKGRLEEFDLEVYKREAQAAQLRRDFQQLLTEERVYYVFQPIFSACSGRVIAYEALMRSDIPSLRSPATIMKLAREQGALYEIERLTFVKSLETFDSL